MIRIPWFLFTLFCRIPLVGRCFSRRDRPTEIVGNQVAVPIISFLEAGAYSILISIVALVVVGTFVQWPLVVNEKNSSSVSSDTSLGLTSINKSDYRRIWQMNPSEFEHLIEQSSPSELKENWSFFLVDLGNSEEARSFVQIPMLITIARKISSSKEYEEFSFGTAKLLEMLSRMLAIAIEHQNDNPELQKQLKSEIDRARLVSSKSADVNLTRSVALAQLALDTVESGTKPDSKIENEAVSRQFNAIAAVDLEDFDFASILFSLAKSYDRLRDGPNLHICTKLLCEAYSNTESARVRELLGNAEKDFVRSVLNKDVNQAAASKSELISSFEKQLESLLEQEYVSENQFAFALQRIANLTELGNSEATDRMLANLIKELESNPQLNSTLVKAKRLQSQHTWFGKELMLKGIKTLEGELAEFSKNEAIATIVLFVSKAKESDSVKRINEIGSRLGKKNQKIQSKFLYCNGASFQRAKRT